MSLNEIRHMKREYLYLLFIAIGVGLIVNIMASIMYNLIPSELLFLISILTLPLLILWFFYETDLKFEPEPIPYKIICDMKTGTILPFQYTPCLTTYLDGLNREEKFRNCLRDLKDKDFILNLQEYILLSFLSGYYNLHWDFFIESNLWADGSLKLTLRRGKNIPSTQIRFKDIKKIFPKNPFIDVFVSGAFPSEINAPRDTKMLYDSQKRKIILENKYCKITFTPSDIFYNRGHQGQRDLAMIRILINCKVIFNKWRIWQLYRIEENLHWTKTMIKLLKHSLKVHSQ